MCLPNFAPKNDDTTLAYELRDDRHHDEARARCTACSRSRPSRPTRRPMRLPKITKYSVAVTAERHQRLAPDADDAAELADDDGLEADPADAARSSAGGAA